MKSFRFLLGIGLIGLLFALSGCPGSKDPELTITQQQSNKLAKAWICTDAKLNGSAVTLPAPNASYNYVGTFVITMKAQSDPKGPTYDTSGRPTGSKVTPWPATGEFTFGTDAATTLVRKEDGVVISYTVSDKVLQMSFTTPPGFLGYDGSRVENVQGNWVFSFGIKP